jgi:uncharacterized protein (TIGR00255 family)
MTGYGEARLQDEAGSIRVEIRSVNHRHFKLNAKFSSPCASIESELEQLVRSYVHRGTVQLYLNHEQPAAPENYRVNHVAIRSYREQLTSALGVTADALPWASLLALPGVVESRGRDDLIGADQIQADWPRIRKVVVSALEKLQTTRAAEGRAMADELKALAATLSEELERVSERAPRLVADYEARLHDRVQSLVAERGMNLEAKDLVREVALFAERADTAEERTRLRAHLVGLSQLIESAESPGRALEFLVQEIGREVNTLGAKANDLATSKSVVAMKSGLDRIRELVQNVE